MCGHAARKEAPASNVVQPQTQGRMPQPLHPSQFWFSPTTSGWSASADLGYGQLINAHSVGIVGDLT